MAEPSGCPTEELLDKVAEVATKFMDFRREALPFEINNTTTPILNMMKKETFKLPMEIEQLGSQLYR